MGILPQDRSISHQQGAVLIVSLVVMLVITLLGVAGMNSSLMQEKMAANAQNTNRAFQAAESATMAITQIIEAGNLGAIRGAMTANDGLSPETPYSVGGDNGVTASYRAEYLGEINITSGSSMDANESSTLLKGYRFELRGTSAINATGAGARIFQGIEYY